MGGNYHQPPPHNRGGARPGAGRPPGEETGRVTVYLPPDLVAAATSMGGGNLSAGVREALRYCAAAGLSRRVAIWQRRADGLRYAVLVDGSGRALSACGPLDDAATTALMAGKAVAVAWSDELADDINQAEESADEPGAYRPIWPARP